MSTTNRYMKPEVERPPDFLETAREARQRRERNTQRRLEADRYNFEKCGRCGLARINVRHETDPANAPEGPDYYRDMEFCDFLPTGTLVR